MKNTKDALPMRIDNSGVCFQTVDWGELNIARVRLPKGANASPLLEGMPDNLCPCPHWGYVIKGSIHVQYADGKEEVIRSGEVYHWPAGHTVWTDEDYEAVEFSPSQSMNHVLDHLAKKMNS